MLLVVPSWPASRAEKQHRSFKVRLGAGESKDFFATVDEVEEDLFIEWKVVEGEELQQVVPLTLTDAQGRVHYRGDKTGELAHYAQKDELGEYKITLDNGYGNNNRYTNVQ